MRTAVGGVHIGEVEAGELGGDDAALLVVVLNRQPVLHAQGLLPAVCQRQSAVCNQRNDRCFAIVVSAREWLCCAAHKQDSQGRWTQCKQTELSIRQHSCDGTIRH